jgi:hypothetical protein
MAMAEAAVLFATAAAIFGAPVLAFLSAVRDFRRRTRAYVSSTVQSSRCDAQKVVMLLSQTRRR